MSRSLKKKVKENTAIESERKKTNKSKSERKSEMEERRRNSRERQYRESAFGGFLVIGFIIQVHDFNFPLFLSKASGAAEGKAGS